MKKAARPGKTTKKTVKKRKKTLYSDAIKAFMLVGVIVALSALISCAVIMVHSTLNNNDASQVSVIEPENAEIEEPKPVIETVVAETEPVENINPAASNTVRPENTTSAVVVPPPAPRPPPRPVEIIGSIVFVIDDAGNNLRELEPFLRIPYPLTIAVLPGLPNSAEAARRIRAAGKEVILHQPMEAIGAQDPGPGAIYTGMSAEEVRTILARNIAEIGPVTGMNNHQGSKVTMDSEIMRVVLAFCADNNIYFLDSRTTSESVVPAVARQMGVQIAERNVFIDNEQNKDAMLRYITGGLTRARRNGTAIMIGHTWSPELAPLLAEQFPIFTEQGYNIRSASDIIKAR